MLNKTCIKCGKGKSVDDFPKAKGTKDGYRNNCKSCVRIYNEKYIEVNKEKFKTLTRKYYEENKEVLKEAAKIYYAENKDVVLQRVALKKDDKRVYNKKYKSENKSVINKKRKERLETDSLYKLRIMTSNLIRSSLKGAKKSKSVDILGCTISEFRIWLENQFDEHMSWENHGTYWHIDHLIPHSSGTTYEEICKLNHYTNLRPLFWLDNLKKSNKLIY